MNDTSPKAQARKIDRWLREKRETGLLPRDVERQAQWAFLSWRTLDQPNAALSPVARESAARDIAQFEATRAVVDGLI